MRNNKKKGEHILLIAIPLFLQLLLSEINELIYFRLMAFVMPIFICGVFVYYLSMYKLKEGCIRDLFILALGTYGVAYIHYRMQQVYFDKYALANDLPLDLEGFAPLIMALIVHAVVYMALGVVIIAIFMFIKVIQHLFGHYEEGTPKTEREMNDWSVWDDRNKEIK